MRTLLLHLTVSGTPEAYVLFIMLTSLYMFMYFPYYISVQSADFTTALLCSFKYQHVALTCKYICIYFSRHLFICSFLFRSFMLKCSQDWFIYLVQILTIKCQKNTCMIVKHLTRMSFKYRFCIHKM